mmetsp:Transcript_18382/g.42112  ORF Transcript_18382/g.42112 Transcript_18382/m.42112 type:complete len:233 (+) Transcript_18382:703-1401(+)
MHGRGPRTGQNTCPPWSRAPTSLPRQRVVVRRGGRRTRPSRRRSLRLQRSRAWLPPRRQLLASARAAARRTVQRGGEGAAGIAHATSRSAIAMRATSTRRSAAEGAVARDVSHVPSHRHRRRHPPRLRLCCPRLALRPRRSCKLSLEAIYLCHCLFLRRPCRSPSCRCLRTSSRRPTSCCCQYLLLSRLYSRWRPPPPLRSSRQRNRSCCPTRRFYLAARAPCQPMASRPLR